MKKLFLCEIEIEALRHGVSCVNYFGLLELKLKCKQMHKIYKPLATRCLAGSLVKTLLSQEVFVSYKCCRSEIEFEVWPYVQLKRLFLQDDSSNAFPGNSKCFVQYMPTLN